MTTFTRSHFEAITEGTVSRRTFLTRAAVVAGAVAAVGTLANPLARQVGAQDVEAAAVYGIGENVMVNTDVLNVRSEPGLAGSVIATLPYGTVGNVDDGPVYADNYRWYQVSVYGEGGVLTGWCAGVYLAPTSSDGGGTGRPAITIIDGPLNLRDEAGLGSNVIGTYPTGATGTYQG
ncbi:MAG: SH3 domain-containing protein, partial [Thermomicrobiales bacterium]